MSLVTESYFWWFADVANKNTFKCTVRATYYYLLARAGELGGCELMLTHNDIAIPLNTSRSVVQDCLKILSDYRLISVKNRVSCVQVNILPPANCQKGHFDKPLRPPVTGTLMVTSTGTRTVKKTPLISCTREKAGASGEIPPKRGNSPEEHQQPKPRNDTLAQTTLEKEVFGRRRELSEGLRGLSTSELIAKFTQDRGERSSQ